VDALASETDGLAARLGAVERTGDRGLSAAEAELLVALDEHLTGVGDLDDADVRRLRSSAVRRILDSEGDLADLAAAPLPGAARAGRSERFPSELALRAVIGVYEGAQELY
jgi:hypothetical protein